MNPLRKLKSLLPPSSRSFHGLYGEVLRMRDEVREMHNEVGHLQASVDANDAHLQMLAFALGSAPDEEYDATRERFFKKLPRATGNDRLVQMACLQLLRDFDAFCQEHGLTYWMISGTLIGAVRHGGFIPWDDDIDLGMTRADILKVLELAAEDNRFMATEVFDYCVTCRQVRFRYRNEDIPCFIDLFLFDMATVEAKAAFDLMQTDRALLKELLAADDNLSGWNRDNQFVPADTAQGMLIKMYFDGIVEKGYGGGGYLTNDPAQAKSAIWAVDNVDAFTGRELYFDYDTIFPVGQLPFEGETFPAPNDPASMLHTIFGDYLSLPGDITTHITHVLDEQLESSETRAALTELTNRGEA